MQGGHGPGPTGPLLQLALPALWLAKAQPGAPGLAEQLLRVGNRAGDPAQGGGWVPRAGRRWQGRRGGEEGGWRRSDRRGAGHGKCDVSAEPSYTSFPSRGAAQPPVPLSSAPPEPVAEPPAMSGVKKQKTVGSGAFPEEVRWWGVPGRRRRTRAPSGDPHPACWLGTRLFWGCRSTGETPSEPSAEEGAEGGTVLCFPLCFPAPSPWWHTSLAVPGGAYPMELS